MSYHGRQLAAARALAGIGVRELAEAAGTTTRTVSALENGGAVHLSPRKRHGHTSAELWQRIVDALSRHGVELLAGDDEHGGGVRWIKPVDGEAR